ncbi:MAG: response regulator [Thermomicrobiales bacterium]
MSALAEPIRVVIADDHPLFRKGMRTLLAGVPEVTLIGEAENGDEAVALTTDLQPDIVLMDLQMPGRSGVQATRDILDTCPMTKILVVTLFDDDDSVFLALRAGARGYVLKDTDEEEMIRAIRAVANGEAIFSPAIATRVLAYFSSPRRGNPEAFPTLTDRERDILGFIAKGRNNPAIARELSLSPKTVANHVSNVFGKLHVADRAEAIVRAREAGLR